MVISELRCLQCGRCCKHFSFFTHMNREEWKVVYRHVMDEQEGLMHVKYLERGSGRFITRTYRPRLEDIESETKRWPFKTDANEFILCPFLAFDYTGAVYYCAIHEIKPQTCREFICAGSTRYGREMEYCSPCWIDGFDAKERPPALRDGSKPCEKGTGCKDFTHRIRFFLAYRKHHPGDEKNDGHARYLRGLVEACEASFSKELKERGMEKASVEQNLDELETLKKALEDKVSW
ncbi:MAG: YkgJ family cysteine cluster protein [Promethearchaeota archaeon]